MSFFKLLLLTLILVMPACTSVAAEGPISPVEPIAPPAEATLAPADGNSLAGTQWRLVSFGAPGAETPVIPGSTLTLQFEADLQAGGSGGCNSYGAQYQVQDSTLTFSQINSTMMACADQRLTQQEQRYFQALETAGQFELADDYLIIWYDGGQGILRFVRGIPPEGPTPSPSEPPERVSFAPGAISTQLNSLQPSGPGLKQYILRANAGQTMTVELTSDDVPLSLTIESPAGTTWTPETLPAETGYRATQTLTLPETGDYLVTLAKADHTPSTNYEIVFTIPEGGP